MQPFDTKGGEDYICFSEKSEKGGRPKKDYIVTLDMAKELCLN
jgi:phage anti-repressor protein